MNADNFIVNVDKLIEDILKINPDAIIDEADVNRIKFQYRTYYGYEVFLVYPKAGIYYMKGTEDPEDDGYRDRIERLLINNRIFDQYGWIRNNIRGLSSFKAYSHYRKQAFEIVLFDPRDPGDMYEDIGLIYIAPHEKEVEFNYYEAKKIEKMFTDPEAKILLDQLIGLFKSLSGLGFRLRNGDINIWMDWESELEEALWTKK